jgi:hypothetical protein
MYFRPNDNFRDVGSSDQKTTEELQKELSQIETFLQAKKQEQEQARARLQILESAKGEMEAVAEAVIKKLKALEHDASLSSAADLETIREYLTGMGKDYQTLKDLDAALDAFPA